MCLKLITDHLFAMAFFRFSSLSFPSKERVQAAQEIYAPMANIEVQTLSQSPIIETRLRLLPGISIGWSKLSPMRVYRKQQHLQDGNDDFSLLLNPSGQAVWSAEIEQCSEFKCPPGMGCLSFGDCPGTLTFSGLQTQILNINISRTLFEPLIKTIKQNQKPIIDQKILSLLTLSAMDLLQEKPNSSLNPLEQANQLVDLASLAVGVHQDYEIHARQQGLKEVRMKAIKADINIHFYRGDLSLDWLAKRHGISPSYIRAMFEQQGTSFTNFLLNLRLEKAYSCLCNPQNTSLTITDIAYNTGFNNPSWFYRAFKQRFGVAPGEIRNHKST